MPARKSLACWPMPGYEMLWIVVLWVFSADVAEGKYSGFGADTSHRQTNASNRCIPSGFDAFPGDFMTQQQRRSGGVIVHCLVALYLCAMISVVCDDYFIPSLELISQKLRLPSDVAGATFMAIGTSAPEFFSSVTGAFITEGDIGVGTVIGSAVFNLLAVTGLAGLVLWNQKLEIDWYPIARDCVAYALAIVFLILIIRDNVVEWWEALILLVIFFIYVVVLCFNSRIERCSKRTVSKVCRCRGGGAEEKAPLLVERSFVAEVRPSLQHEPSRDSFSAEITASRQKEILQNGIITVKIDEVLLGDEDDEGSLCRAPRGGCRFVRWLILYPASLLFALTIPDMRRHPFRRCFVLTFVMAVVWIGLLSYLAVWMVTIIGYTFSIPDSVSGLTLLAAGTSVPEILSSIIVARDGLGNMAISNLVGSNTFDITFCLGVPWLVKALIAGSLYVYSSALTYTTATLLLTLLAFYLVLYAFRWRLGRSVGGVLLALYVVFVVLACLYELNVLADINVPACDS